MTRDQRRDVEFAGRVKAAIILGELLAQQPVGADHDRLASAQDVLGRAVIEHQQVVADRVEGVDVAAGEQPAGIGERRAFLVEHAVAQLLGLPHFGGGLRRAAPRASRSGRATAGARVAREPARPGGRHRPAAAAAGPAARAQMRQAGISETAVCGLAGRDLPLNSSLRRGKRPGQRVLSESHQRPVDPKNHGSTAGL